MHKLTAKPITIDSFEFPVCDEVPPDIQAAVDSCEVRRQCYLKTKDKAVWYELIRLLPESWLQRRTVTLTYENLFAMCSKGQRRFHKLEEWSGTSPDRESFIQWARSLPYAQELIFTDELEEKVAPACKTKVICISGKAGSGKDTLAGIMKSDLEKQGFSVLVTHFADLLKHILRTFFGWDGQKDEAGRGLLQYVGTERIRKIHPDYWVDFIADILKIFPNEWDYVLIPDARFPNEIAKLRECGLDVRHLRVKRDGVNRQMTSEEQQHISETALDSVTPDVAIENNGTLEELKEQYINAREMIV